MCGSLCVIDLLSFRPRTVSQLIMHFLPRLFEAVANNASLCWFVFLIVETICSNTCREKKEALLSIFDELKAGLGLYLIDLRLKRPKKERRFEIMQ